MGQTALSNNRGVPSLGELTPAFATQPIVTAGEWQFHGHEFLARVHGFDGTIVAPNALFELAGERGHLLDIDEWLCQAVLADQRAQLPTISFINLRAESLLRENVADRIASAGTDSRLVVELSERSDMTQWTAVRDPIEWLRHLGVAFALDDIGAGASVLPAIGEIPFDYAKLDRSLIRAAQSSARGRLVVGEVIRFCQRTGSTVVCEGVEQLSDARLAEQMGCELLQGYHTGRPAMQSTVSSFS